jgi:uncharacterized peroxidase-related enzyme
LLRDDAMAEEIESDFETAHISERRKAMLRYSVKLTSHPATVTEDDIRVLRDVGFEDIDILHIAEVVGYYAYANRIADGLGIPLEDWIRD